MARVEFSAWSLLSGTGVPEVCARHGRPAVKRVEVRMYSRPAWWVWLLWLIGGALGGVLFFLALRYTRKVIDVSEWPFCARCRTRRIITLSAGLLMIAAGVTLAVVALGNAVMISADDSWLGMLYAGIAVEACGIYVAWRSRAQGTAGASVPRDGEVLVVRRAHQRFAARAAELAAGEHERMRSRSLFPYKLS